MGGQAELLLAHEWLEPTGGSENTFEQMIEVFPQARIACLWNNAPHRFPRAEESWLARSPVRRSKAASLAFMHHAWHHLDLSGVQTVVASSHAMSHHLAGRAAHLGLNAFAYVYSPPRYLWAADLDARGQGRVARMGRVPARKLDLAGVHPGVKYGAISRFVADRMRDSWRVDAEVFYPPVDTERIGSVPDWTQRLSEREAERLNSLPEEFVLGASRLIQYKRLDVAMRVGDELGMPVVIAGDGPFAPELKAYAREEISVPVHFVGRVSDEGLYSLYQRARLFVFMPIEDFGIMPIEAMALGTPAVVRDVGGAREVADLLGVGVPADPDDVPALADAARLALDGPRPNPEVIANTFSVSKFRRDFSDFVGVARESI